MWVARDKGYLNWDNEIIQDCVHLFWNKPKRAAGWLWCGDSAGDKDISYLFPNLKWEDEPIEVRLVENNPIHKHICPHCGKIVKYYDSDIKTSYDCQPSSTLPDFGEEYIICPECKKLIYI